MTMMEMISELYMMNRFQCITFNVLLLSFFLYLFFQKKKKKSQSKFLLGFFELVLALLPRG